MREDGLRERYGLAPPGAIFFALAAILAAPLVAIIVIAVGAAEGEGRLGTPDARLWACLLTALVAGVLSAWLLALRPRDRIVWVFAASGAATYTFCMAAAALLTQVGWGDGAVLSLVSLNVLGACAFGVAMIALFALYPSPLRGARWIIAANLAVFGTWTGLSYLGPLNLWVEVHRITLMEMIVILALAGMQVAASWRDPVRRAIAAWLAACVGVGAGGFIALVAAPATFGLAPVIPNEFGFLFFILIYVGLAVGLLRLRVFGLGRWAFQLLFNVGAALCVLALDGALIFALSLEPGPAIGVSLFLVALAYLPARALIWERVSRRHKRDQARLFRAVADIALQPTPERREAAWRALLDQLYAPLDMVAASEAEVEADLEAVGRVLRTPGPEGFPALILRDRDGGRALFTPDDAATVRELSALVTYLGENRTAYDRGAAFERARIARDIHDNIGAQLLTALHAPAGGRKDELIRETIGDLRDVIRNAEGESTGLDALIADLRAETADRVEIAGLGFAWTAGPVRSDPPRRAAVQALRAVVREAVTNALRHASASNIHVELSEEGHALRLRIEDDGHGFKTGPAHAPGSDGRGVGNMRERIETLGGRFDLETGRAGTRIDVTLPMFEIASVSGEAVA